MHMGGRDGLASQPRCYRMPGQPLLNRDQVGGVSCSPHGLFAQQEGVPTRGQTSREGERDDKGGECAQGMGHPEGQPWGPCSATSLSVYTREPAPSGPPMGPMMCPVQPPVCAGDQAPREPTLRPLRHSAVVCRRPGDRGSSPLGRVWSRAPGAHAHGNTERQAVDDLRTEVFGQRKQSNDPHNNQHNLNMSTTARR